MRTEIKVGALVLVAIAVLAYFVIKIQDIGSFRSEDSYVINVRFDNAAGIGVDDPALLAGVRVGRVSAVRLNMQEGVAEVELQLMRAVELHDDAVAIVGSTGMLGARVLDLRPGSPDRPLVPEGGWIRGGDPVSVDQLVEVMSSIGRNLDVTTRTLSAVLGTAEGEASLREILINVQSVTGRFDEILAANRAVVDSGFGNMDSAFGNINELSATLKESLPQLIDEMRNLSAEVSEVIGRSGDGLGSAGENLLDVTERLQRSAADLEEILGKANRGEGTVGRLINESDTVDRLNEALDSVDDSLAAADTFFRRVGEAQFSFEWRSEFYERLKSSKNYFGLRLELGEQGSGRGFEFHLVDDNIGGIDVSNITTQTFDPISGDLLSTTLERKLVRSEGFRVSAVMAQRFGRLQVRGGILESQAGFGVDYFAVQDRLRFIGEVWDLGRDPDPHVKLRFQWNLSGRFFLTGGWDDALRSGLQSYYLGGGYSFNR
jgi:phospholipid/cholesterol/gamma-HCH transport system substrate-binding protein